MAEPKQIIARNKKARFRFELFDKYEAGLELRGTEVKSLRNGKASIEESFARPKGGQLFVLNMHIPPYAFGTIHNHAPRRRRKVLLHGREIRRLAGKIQEKGLSLIPLRIYFRRGRAKVELALGKGRKLHDKREAIRQRETKREMEREMRRHGR